MSFDPLYKAAMFSRCSFLWNVFSDVNSWLFLSSLCSLSSLRIEAFATVQNEPCSFNLLAMANNFTRLYVLR